MGRLQRFFKWFKSDGAPIDEDDARILRLEFQSRYHQFKLLLNANNQALEIMTELEQAMTGNVPFGMKFIRSRTMGAYTRVYQIVKHLHALAPGKYKALSVRLEKIRLSLESMLIIQRPVDSSAPLVLPFSVLDKTFADQAGMKMASIGEIANRLNLRVPDGFVVTAKAFRLFLEQNDLKTEIQRRIQSAEEEGHHQLYTTSADIRRVIQDAPLPQDLEEAIMAAYQALASRRNREPNMAVRSSALNEDREGASFAGLYHSALNVSRDHLADTYKQIVAAAYSPAVMAYRFSRGLADEDTEMCVGIMEMVDAVSGGVLYSANPMNIRDQSVIINSAWGLPKAVVDGTTATDLFQVTKSPALSITHRTIAAKEKKYVCYPGEGVCRLDDTGQEMMRASLTDRQALELAALAVRIEEYFGCPQDIEWALDQSGEIILLQCRPLQVNTDAPAPLSASGEHDDLPPVLFQGGITASPGVASGPVHRVMKDVDALQFPDGAVLVTDRALARWAALLPRASAVVSEKGGLTGHLANVAREFRVPALFGASGVIDRLSGQEQITVDADGCRIYPGQVRSLLALSHRRPPTNLMEGTPIFGLLEKSAGLITPLNLLDPDSPTFKASNCRTLHDITRFCHEKSVHEMFRFGKAHRFPERSSKQLRAQIPMQWWVLNLDDGFKTDVSMERYVDIDNITSIPMLALWAGITAFPWEGPPPVDGKGFVSVMFQATQNQALLPTVRTTMANRNYFMISKNYCSLQSRLGFHFCITEALVGDRTTENYVSFQFKGGAADFNRRLKRVRFVKEILDIHGFRTDVTKDALRARIEQYDAEIMVAKLKILGYLSIHTRQLDMIMANPAMVERYRVQIQKQIDAIFSVSHAPVG
ncbi:PEP/pyruvate-binding domain-containing protein [uncultured Desulfosarcina sp.]|uniref:PEP/pyruvate-binding domain-containing protein n=1 Tax=uncultured Desulfosarcina sp. TaxID=218289 RepID=UPI0029C91B2E|nr:PEP/pyruvate-binding domain-containing protein [uncultured Desulfosarcina sp.]